VGPEVVAVRAAPENVEISPDPSARSTFSAL
jgi:hypothetical protein